MSFKKVCFPASNNIVGIQTSTEAMIPHHGNRSVKYSGDLLQTIAFHIECQRCSRALTGYNAASAFV